MCGKAEEEDESGDNDYIIMARGRVKERSIDLLCLVSSNPLVNCGTWKPWTPLNTEYWASLAPADSHTAQRQVAGQAPMGRL